MELLSDRPFQGTHEEHSSFQGTHEKNSSFLATKEEHSSFQGTHEEHSSFLATLKERAASLIDLVSFRDSDAIVEFVPPCKALGCYSEPSDQESYSNTY
jgi:hypothetical protein